MLLVDDHPIVLEGLGTRVELEGDMTVCGMAATAAQAMELLERSAPDIVVTDLSLSGKPGLELIKEIRAARPGLPILVLSIHDEELWAERVLRAGAQGYVMKAQATEKVMDAIHRVLAGGVWLSERMSALLLGRLTQGRAAPSGTPLAALSDRELEVFQMIGQGMSVKEIASHLFLSAKTVEVHREHIKEKLGLKSSAELLRYAVTYALEEPKP
ncbi:MAG: response regulator transcription factor [Tepidisphaeraceae bacterium]